MDAQDPYAPPKADVSPPAAPDASPLASRWARLGGAFVDGIFIALVTGGLNLLIYRDWSINRGTEAKSGWVDTLIFFLPELIWIALNARLLHTRGQTVGKIAAGTRIVRRDGQPTTFWLLFGMRYVPLWGIQFIAALVELLVPSLATVAVWAGGLVALGNILLIFRKSRACLHDDIAGTKVISVRVGAPQGQNWNAGLDRWGRDDRPLP